MRATIIALLLLTISLGISFGKEELNALIPSEVFRRNLEAFPDRTVSEFWNPGLDEISQAEKQLPEFIAKRLAEEKDDKLKADLKHIWSNLDGQRRQYVGLSETEKD